MSNVTTSTPQIEELVLFILRDKKLFAFYDLRNVSNPFAAAIDLQNVEMLRATDLWRDAEGKRRYVALLNRSLYKHTARLGISYDPAHYRFYFSTAEEGKERSVRYRSLNGRWTTRKVAWQPKRKSTGEGRNFWWHRAAGLRFHEKVKQYDLIALCPTSEVRLVRTGQYPPLRGLSFTIGDVSYLYTSGYLTALGGYPHGHVPSPLQIADHIGDTPRTQLMREILVLTKMNWNSANFSGLWPITLRFSRLVGDILREVPADETPQPKYKYYM